VSSARDRCDIALRRCPRRLEKRQRAGGSPFPSQTATSWVRCGMLSWWVTRGGWRCCWVPPRCMTGGNGVVVPAGRSVDPMGAISAGSTAAVAVTGAALSQWSGASPGRTSEVRIRTGGQAAARADRRVPLVDTRHVRCGMQYCNAPSASIRPRATLRLWSSGPVSNREAPGEDCTTCWPDGPDAECQGSAAPSSGSDSGSRETGSAVEPTCLSAVPALRRRGFV